LVIVLDWLAVTPLLTLWLPLPTWMPGLMFAPALTALFAMFAFASTPTFGFTLSAPETDEPEVLLGAVLPVPLVVLDCPTDEPCVELDVAPVLFAVWFAVTPLVTLWLPLPTFTPGLMLAPRFTSVLLMLALASTPTFGFTLSVGLTDRPLLELEGVVEDVEGDVEDDEPEGEVLEVEPLIEPLLVEAEPLVAPLDVEVEPLRPLPEALLPDMPLPDVPLVVAPPLVVPPAIEPLVPLLLALVLSSMQSLCTGLAECSFALPVSLSASLPALGFL